MPATPKSQTFDALPNPMKAAWRWVDAFAAAGGAPLTHPESLNGLNWTWEELGRGLASHRDAVSHPRSEEATELLSAWFSEASDDPAAAALLASKMSWCFMHWDWEPEDGIFVYLWPTDAPELEIEALDMPVSPAFWNAMEGVWSMSARIAEEAEAMRAVWDELSGLGFFFDEAIQKNPEGTAYAYANENPEAAWEKAVSAIPELRAREEAAELDRTAGRGKDKNPKSTL